VAALYAAAGTARAAGSAVSFAATSVPALLAVRKR